MKNFNMFIHKHEPKYKTPSLIKTEGPKIRYYKSRLKFVMTCPACPEQYDVLHENEVVGYVRLRHGYLYALVCDKEFNYEVEVYSTSKVCGDGAFFDEKERNYHLNKIKDAIYKELNNHQIYWKFDNDRAYSNSVHISGNRHIIMINKNPELRIGDWLFISDRSVITVCKIIDHPDFKKNKQMIVYKFVQNLSFLKKKK